MDYKRVFSEEKLLSAINAEENGLTCSLLSKGDILYTNCTISMKPMNPNSNTPGSIEVNIPNTGTSNLTSVEDLLKRFTVFALM